LYERLLVADGISAFHYSAGGANPEPPGLPGFGIAQEDAADSLGRQLVRSVSILNMYVCLTAKQPEVLEIRNGMEPGLVGSGDRDQSRRRTADKKVDCAFGCLCPKTKSQ
jgi:hypothetical protein